MVLLYQESEEDVTKSSGFITDVGIPKAENNLELEKRVISLETTIKVKDTALDELKNELAAVKV